MSKKTVFFSWDASDYASDEGGIYTIEVDAKAAIIISFTKNPTVVLTNSLNECGCNVPEVDDVIAALEKMQVTS